MLSVNPNQAARVHELKLAVDRYLKWRTFCQLIPIQSAPVQFAVALVLASGNDLILLHF